jgi:hypothetical protein
MHVNRRQQRRRETSDHCSGATPTYKSRFLSEARKSDAVEASVGRDRVAGAFMFDLLYRSAPYVGHEGALTDLLAQEQILTPKDRVRDATEATRWGARWPGGRSPARPHAFRRPSTSVLPLHHAAASSLRASNRTCCQPKLSPAATETGARLSSPAQTRARGTVRSLASTAQTQAWTCALRAEQAQGAAGLKHAC